MSAISPCSWRVPSSLFVYSFKANKDILHNNIYKYVCNLNLYKNSGNLGNILFFKFKKNLINDKTL